MNLQCMRVSQRWIWVTSTKLYEGKGGLVKVCCLSGQRHLINMSAVPVDLCLSLKKLHTHTHTHTDTNKIEYNIVNIRSQGM